MPHKNSLTTLCRAALTAATIGLTLASNTANAYYVVVDEVESAPTQGQSGRMGMGLPPTRTAPVREDEYAVPFPEGVTPITGVTREVLDRIADRLNPNALITPSKLQQAVKEIEVATAKISATEEAPMAITSIAGTRIDLVKGKSIDQQFSRYATLTGWVLQWDASEYVLDNNHSIQGDFETALTTFLQATNESGSRLRATFYRGNKTVRVQEF